MAKLLKHVLVGSELVYLGKHESVSSLNQDPVSENTLPSINELELEEMKDEAWQKGFLSGKAEGKALVEQEIALLKHQLESSLTAIPQVIAQNRLELSAEIADIVLLITQQFFMEKESNPQALEHQINQLISQLNNNQTVELHLHPQEINTLQSGLIKLETAHLNGLKIKSDASLTLGGYVIKTDHGIFDASIEKQIDKLKDLLLAIRQRGPNATLD